MSQRYNMVQVDGCYKFVPVATPIGEGIISNLKKRFLPRKAESERLKKFLEGEGSQAVVSIEIARKPVHTFVRQALNAVSGGRFNKKAKELGYDDVYHNYLLVYLKDGTVYRLEKNHQVEINPAKTADLVKDRSEVPIAHDMDLKDMLNKASAGDKDFWEYDARSSNCQDFTRDVLTRNGLTPLNPPQQQDARALTGTLPTKGVIAKKITDAAAYGDQVIHGGSTWGPPYYNIFAPPGQKYNPAQLHPGWRSGGSVDFGKWY